MPIYRLLNFYVDIRGLLYSVSRTLCMDGDSKIGRGLIKYIYIHASSKDLGVGRLIWKYLFI